MESEENNDNKLRVYNYEVFKIIQVGLVWSVLNSE